MFQCVVAVTFLVSDLSVTESAYRDFLGYQTHERGTVTETLGAVWNSPAMVGRGYLVMGPASGSAFRLRFIQADPVEGYAPLTTEGWNATELLVQDPDAMVERLKNSPFEIIGMPYDLSSDGGVRAMQIKGPSGEILYLTRITGNRQAVYGSAQSMVDRAFILVVGAKDYTALVDFYGKNLGHKIRPFGKTKITVLSKALGLDPEQTQYELRLAEVGNQYNLELDSYPDVVKTRPKRPGELPPGMSMVTFAVKDLQVTALDWVASARPVASSLYDNNPVAVTTGPGGEWIELIEDADGGICH